MKELAIIRQKVRLSLPNKFTCQLIELQYAFVSHEYQTIITSSSMSVNYTVLVKTNNKAVNDNLVVH